MNPREFMQVAAAAPDFRALFESAPGLYLVLDPSFDIVAASDAWCLATQTARENVIGRNLFDIFLDTSDADASADPTRDGVVHLRQSLEFVLTHRCRHRLAMQKCETRGEGGIEEHYWSALNTPVVDETGEVCWIIHSFEDLTETMRECRNEARRAEPEAPHQAPPVPPQEPAHEKRHKVDRFGRPFALSVTGTFDWGTFP